MRTRGERDKIRSTRAFCFSFTLTDSGTACVNSSTRQWEACVLSERRNLWIWLMDACFFPPFLGALRFPMISTASLETRFSSGLCSFCHSFLCCKQGLISCVFYVPLFVTPFLSFFVFFFIPPALNRPNG